MATGFVTVAAVKRWAVADGTVGIYTAVLLAGQMVGNLILGFLADRRGHKLSLEIGALGSLLAFALAWLAPSSEWYFLVFFLMGLVQAAIIISGILVVMEFCGPDQRPTYIGLSNTGVGIINIAGPMVGALLALAGYNWLFAASVAAALASFIAFHWWVKEPRKQVRSEIQTLPIEH